PLRSRRRPHRRQIAARPPSAACPAGLPPAPIGRHRPPGRAGARIGGHRPRPHRPPRPPAPPLGPASESDRSPCGARWSGSRTAAISFGLVNVPVKLYSATSPKTVRFHQLSSKTGTRVRQKRVDPSTGDEVAFEDIVKGYELTPDRYVLIEPDELDALDPK